MNGGGGDQSRETVGDEPIMRAGEGGSRGGAVEAEPIAAARGAGRSRGRGRAEDPAVRCCDGVGVGSASRFGLGGWRGDAAAAGLGGLGGHEPHGTAGGRRGGRGGRRRGRGATGSGHAAATDAVAAQRPRPHAPRASQGVLRVPGEARPGPGEGSEVGRTEGWRDGE